ncbi:hypothetical protein GFY24_08375 [Nocardia sp. SYP-A9097]|uniref:hypothetical protein n=1 Tax=Nocardia sp. SYP-A9097 TaxID=2663237 RepID=UPI00129AC943|nr:hypothetical protein [Nocardia sp. SYP-A9097]MRH87471.1 hypothetical protein [Nocardia sp. SYP-A9097]
MSPVTPSLSRLHPDTRLWASGAAQGGAWTSQAPVPGATSPDAPALTVFQHDLHMAWRAEDSTDSIWFSSTGDGETWETPWNLPYVGTSEQPALCAVNETLYLAWKGAGREQNIYWSTSADGHKWEDQQILGGAETSRSPSLVAFHGVLRAFWRGGEHLITSNQNLYLSVRGETGWSAPIVLPGMASVESPAVAVLGDTLYLAHRGTKAPLDNDKWIRLWSSGNGVAWTSRANPAEAYTDLAPALAADNGTLHLVWKSASGPEIWYSPFDGDQTWQPPARVAAFETACSPALCDFRPTAGTSEVFLAWRGSTL